MTTFKFSPGDKVWFKGDIYTILHRRGIDQWGRPSYWLAESDRPVLEQMLS